MVRVHTDTQQIDNLYDKLGDTRPTSERIKISSDFQRGDEETGVWNRQSQRRFIDSLRKKYPVGMITLVKEHGSATSYQDPYKVLDGGNRLRAIRDYMSNKFTDQDGIYYKDLDPLTQAQLRTLHIPCQSITIERNDPPDTIANMFTRLNTTAKKLSEGELFKARGWRGNNWVIEVAKQIIGMPWESDYDSAITVQDQPFPAWIRERWISIFGPLEETKRCDNIAMLVGYILSATKSNFKLFDKRYDNLKAHLPLPGQNPTEKEVEDICNKLDKFLSIMNNIYDRDIFGSLTKGMPSKSKIAHIWYTICRDTMTNNLEKKIVEFYEAYLDDSEVRKEFGEVARSGDGWIPAAKMGRLIEFIENW